MHRYFFIPLAAFLLMPTYACAAAGGFDVMSLLPIVLIFAVFYFLLLRPQQQKMKTHQNMLTELKRGDRVVTSGGIVGLVQKTTDVDAIIEISDGVSVTVMKQMITEVLSLKNGENKKTSKLNAPVVKKNDKQKNQQGKKADVVSINAANAGQKNQDPAPVDPVA